ncbi:dihydrofolate reductase [Bartonella sp. DGB1]|uniref:dihydrofolate reductase n=1 Tax=Bartonella sp. DGB1 TaxID=3239807 RepID=UPI0035256428
MISFIVAATENQVIGNKGDMPWKLKSDLKRFKQITLNHVVIMGHATFVSIGKILPNRQNIIISRNEKLHIDNAIVVNSPDAAIEKAYQLVGKDAEIFVIGGGKIFEQLMTYAEVIYFTRVLANIEGDTYFPKLDSAKWKLTYQENIIANEGDSHDTIFQIYKKIRS